jgi:hypothetical protein
VTRTLEGHCKSLGMKHPATAPSKPGLFTCAAGFANKYSIAGGLNALSAGATLSFGYLGDATCR